VDAPDHGQSSLNPHPRRGPPPPAAARPPSRTRRLLGPRLRSWAAALCALAAAWVTVWGLAARRSRRPLLVDRWVDGPLLRLGPDWQRLATGALRWEEPVVLAVLAALAAFTLALRRPAWTATVLAGVTAELSSVQLLIKPVVDRHELAPGASFPSSYVGAASVVATLTVIVVGAGMPRGRANVVAVALTALVALAAVSAVAVATMATAGHRFSDVITAVPWGAAMGLGACSLSDTLSATRASKAASRDVGPG